MDKKLLDLLGLSRRETHDPQDGPPDTNSERRKKMVKNQIARRGISDPDILRAMLAVPRHAFVPHHLRERAYDDSPLPIGSGQTISQPYIVAYMTDMLRLRASDSVLEIGTGSGYQGAVLAQLANAVFSVEIVAWLGQQAADLFEELGYDNIQVRVGDGTAGWPEEAPFHAIMVTAAPQVFPDSLIDQLRPGGRMIVPVGDLFQYLYLVEKTETGVQKKRLLPVRFVPMTGLIER